MTSLQKHETDDPTSAVAAFLPAGVSRRTFVTASSAAIATPFVAVCPVMARATGRDADDYLGVFPYQDPEELREIVRVAHFDLDEVSKMVTARPELAKAAIDWGFGDWESALGAASHMGRRDMAELLMHHGARPNLFTHAMMGHVDVVRATCKAVPGIQQQAGPHGITLLSHARQGGDEAASVLEYLQELGGADIGVDTAPLTEADAGVYVGRYQPKDSAGAVFNIAYRSRGGMLTFERDGGSKRFLKHLGDHTFSPGGAGTVKISFDVVRDRAKGLRIQYGSQLIAASRLA